MFFFVWYENLDSFFFRFVLIQASDGQTDRILIARPRLHSMQRGKKKQTRVGGGGRFLL